MSSFPNLKFDNAVLRELPVDKEFGSRQRQVPAACFSLIEQSPVENPKLVAFSTSALSLLGINEDDIINEDFVKYFGGNQKFDGSQPAAHCYCGHQFGSFAGQLGDGAAMYLGEIINEKNERWELQLKGAGLTPYSRQADGRKVLRSSIREFLCSEAMFNLEIPTTRASTCVTSDSYVVRDMFYDGHPKQERCTIVSRMAPTFLRFGSFEIFKSQDPITDRSGPSVNHKEMLPQMLDYVIKYFYPEIDNSSETDQKLKYFEFYKEIIRRTAKLVAMWQCVGFCHGVLNTDNMSIIGLTIDYGPFGFMDYFDIDHICNSSDTRGRYTYKQQPEICKWNLWKLGEAIKDQLPSVEAAKETLNEIYDNEFSKHYYEIMKNKLGLTNVDQKKEKDEELIQDLLQTMQKTSCDFTNTFCVLMDSDWFEESSIEVAANTLVTQCLSIEGVKEKFRSSANISQLMILLQLSNHHPQILSQMGVTKEQVERMIEKSEKDKELTRMSQEERDQHNYEAWMEWLKKYKERVQREFKGCNEEEKFEVTAKRQSKMQKVNPRVILRNHLAQEAIEAAEADDYSKVQELLKVLQSPYEKLSSNCTDNSETCRKKVSKFSSCRPASGKELLVS